MFSLVIVVAGLNRICRGFIASGTSRTQLDLEHAVHEGSGLYLDVLGQIELPPERARRDSLIQQLMRTFISLAAFDGQHVLARADGHLATHEPARASDI